MMATDGRGRRLASRPRAERWYVRAADGDKRAEGRIRGQATESSVESGEVCGRSRTCMILECLVGGVAAARWRKPVRLGG